MSPTETQQSVYSLSQNDYHVITSGSNGYSAAAGYNLVTGLGTPVANLLVPDLVAGNFPATGQVPPASAAAFVHWATTGGNAGGPANMMNVFDALTMTASSDTSSATDDAPATAMSTQTPATQDLTIGHGTALAAALRTGSAGLTASSVDPFFVGDPPVLDYGNIPTSTGDSQDQLLANYASPPVVGGPLVESLPGGQGQETSRATEGLAQADRGSSGLTYSLLDATETTTQKVRRNAALDRVFTQFGQGGLFI